MICSAGAPRNRRLRQDGLDWQLWLQSGDFPYYGGAYYGGPCCYHPVATAMAVTTAAVVTAAVVGSMVSTLPPSCSAVIVNGISYQHIVVNQPH